MTFEVTSENRWKECRNFSGLSLTHYLQKVGLISPAGAVCLEGILRTAISSE
jgi:hypothetical protein